MLLLMIIISKLLELLLKFFIQINKFFLNIMELYNLYKRLFLILFVIIVGKNFNFF